jgi:glycosyltransferase involved in cell wall biosynthesis
LGDLAGDNAPAITWLMLRSAGWKLPESRIELKQLASKIRHSGLFDARYYFAQLGTRAAAFDPIIHYLLVGERLGLAPSREFNPSYYGARYLDVALAGTNYLIHFVEFGRAEGRSPVPAQVMRAGCVKIDPGKENVILVVHEASRTGAPIHGWNIAVELARTYNVFTVSMLDGELTPEFQALSVELYGPFPESKRDPVDIEYSLRPLLDVRKYRYAVVNSAASHLLVEPCVRRFIPTVLLVHEFGSYLGAGFPLAVALDSATEIVFPAELVKRAAEENYPNLRGRSVHVMPQGKLVPPSAGLRASTHRTLTSLAKFMQRAVANKSFIVLGIGTVELRKGVDLFVAVAASAFRRRPGTAMHFLWVGEGYRPREDTNYSVFIEEQVKRSGLTDHITFLDSIPDVEPVYRAAGAFLLSSRLDPLPNVTIDAAFRGVPVVCFRDASGMAELMLTNPDTAVGVVDYLDSEAAANILLQLERDQSFRERTAQAMQSLARQHFDMKGYVARLDVLGIEAGKRMKQLQDDAYTLCGDPSFDQDMFLGPTPVVEMRDETIVRYLTKGGECGWEVSPSLSYRRRPCPGFNPRVYAAAKRLGITGVDPLADFVRQGRPAGPWQADVLRPDDPIEEVIPKGEMRTLVHAHFFYPDLGNEFLAHLTVNRSPCDLIVTTDTSSKASQLRQALCSYSGGRVDIRVVPNRGRDIGALLTELRDDLITYDLIGHLHGKRSPYTGESCNVTSWGDDWREFLWQNLIGGLHPMMDRIIAAFERQSDLGLVFPSDPNVCGWDENRDYAGQLAARMGWVTSLPDHFDFPVGTMFWIRLDALRPLLNLGLSWEDYPHEPLARDGTLLHALERLLTFSCQMAGFKHAVTHVFGVSWMPPI